MSGGEVTYDGKILKHLKFECAAVKWPCCPSTTFAIGIKEHLTCTWINAPLCLPYSAAGQIRCKWKNRNIELYIRMRQKRTYLYTDSSATIETSTVAENINEFSSYSLFFLASRELRLLLLLYIIKEETRKVWIVTRQSSPWVCLDV